MLFGFGKFAHERRLVNARGFYKPEPPSRALGDFQSVVDAFMAVRIANYVS
jgi:hypothetical protein